MPTMTRKRLPLRELQKLIDPVYEKHPPGESEASDIAFGIELGKILERTGWTRDEFTLAMELMSDGATTEEADNAS